MKSTKVWSETFYRLIAEADAFVASHVTRTGLHVTVDTGPSSLHSPFSFAEITLASSVQ